MKKILNGEVNEVSFIKVHNMVDEPYTIVLTKVVGTDVYTFSSLSDIYSWDTDKDFIVLEVDLTATDVAGGEYILRIFGDSGEYGEYVCIVDDYSFVNSTSTNELLSSTVKISNL